MTSGVIKWLVLLVVITLAGGSIYYTYQDTRPCTHPVAYGLGAVDPRFETATSTLLAQAKAAANIWNKAQGETLLVYDPDARLKINLVYDEREANAKLGREIARRLAGLDTTRVALDVLQADFSARQAMYNQKVQEINARGGATKGETVALNAERDTLGRLADSLNNRVANYNASVRALNAEITKYDELAGRPFEEGQYIRDASGERINVFEFVDAEQLKRVLAHELGHAIGLDHTQDPKSIMYAKNESGNLVPTADDLAALKALCGA